MGRVIGLHCVAVGYWGYDGGEEGGYSECPPTAIILARSVLIPFNVTSEGSKSGVGEDVGVLAQQVGCVGLERVLSNCPVLHRKQ